MIGRLVVGALLVSAAACENAGSDRVLSVGLSGSMNGVVVFDANGNGVAEASDTTVAGVTIRVVRTGSGAVVASEVTDGAGTYRFDPLPVGEYDLRIDTASAGDTVVVASQSVTQFTIEPSDSLVSSFIVRYPFATLTEVRSEPVGRRVFVRATALTALGVFGDTTVHVADATGSLRITRVRPSVIAIGDSVRMLGRRNVRNGQPTLDDVSVFPLSVGVLPTVDVLTTGVAAGADAGRVDAALVSVLNVAITDTATVQGRYRMTTDDGSGVLVVVLSPAIGFVTAAMVPGANVDVTGVLVPVGSGVWELKPRVTADVVVR